MPLRVIKEAAEATKNNAAVIHVTVSQSLPPLQKAVQDNKPGPINFTRLSPEDGGFIPTIIGVQYVIRKYVIRVLIRVLRIMRFGREVRSVLRIVSAHFWTNFNFITYAHFFLNGWQI